VQNVITLFKEDGVRVVERVVEVNVAGRAYKNDPALFVLALAFTVGGVVGLTPRLASAAITERNHAIMGFSTTFRLLNISARQRLDDVVKSMNNLPFSETDCALPMVWALKENLAVDAFVVYTDNETWFGKIHPARALNEYRRKIGIPAKLIVVAMTGNKFSIADPNDAGMLDVVGFSTDTPNVMADFIRE
jgi:60 kDa SS-A/Ro ribonucleoprotein